MRQTVFAVAAGAFSGISRSGSADERRGIERSPTGLAVSGFRALRPAQFDGNGVRGNSVRADRLSPVNEAITLKPCEDVRPRVASQTQGYGAYGVTLQPFDAFAAVLAEPGLIEVVRHLRRIN